MGTQKMYCNAEVKNELVCWLTNTQFLSLLPWTAQQAQTPNLSCQGLQLVMRQEMASSAASTALEGAAPVDLTAWSVGRVTNQHACMVGPDSTYS
jgi:hypothetical protein